VRQRKRHRHDQDLARLRSLLQTCRHIHRVPGREQLIRHRRNLTAVHPDSKLQPRPEVALTEPDRLVMHADIYVHVTAS
jgi:hypothetical protein